jgi:TolB-like protein
VSLFAELRRRGVLKVGGAYVVVAWVVVQVASIAFPAFDAPAWALRVFILVAMLGFPVAVAMAWVLEVTPDGLRHEPSHLGNKRVFGISAALAALALAWYFVGQPALRVEQAEQLAKAATPAPAAPAAEPAPPAKSIAVLPFVNMSADKDNEYFSDGISEELLNALVRVEGLEVASRTSSFAYKGRADLGAGRIARELKVAHLLEGSVRKSGTKVRITAQLIDATNDRHLWSEVYDRELTDIFAIQDEIAKAIVLALRAKLDGAAAAPAAVVKADTENMQAYDLYLKARGLFIERRELPEVVRLYERAIELDPQFARAHEGLAAVCAVMPGWGYDDRDYIALGEKAAARALELDPTLSMPWAARAEMQKGEWPIDYTRGLEMLDKALAADPHNTTAVFWKGIIWLELGYFDRAIELFDRCLAMEPKYHNCRSHKALALVQRGDEAAGLAEYERTVADDAYLSRIDHFVAPLVRKGDRTGAWLLLERNDIGPELRQAIMAAIERPGPPSPEAKAVVARTLADPDASPELKALGRSRFHLWIGDFEAMDLEAEADLGAIYAWERHPPAFRNSPAMKRIVRDMGVLAYWRTQGFPPQCRPVGKDDFTCD